MMFLPQLKLGGFRGKISWGVGSPSLSSSQIISFDLLDELLTRLDDDNIFPNLSTGVLAGFSAGGQYVNRYSMTN